ncbi:hypothetical protein GALMADRAFT_139360 [Galerina marginata CBS 339.88]|uniref:Uncharacterized protein n=1 Tax=Galerina marginata (strain CBS 339.88) TaxID=685588 RepID=A0A067T4W1_GALM3|nr:hypothetical protein GALMADRAFT_139360 [Galerina marginata CBS 339.88]
MSMRRHLRSLSPDSDVKPFSWIRYFLAIALALFAGIAFDMDFLVLKAVLQELPIISLHMQYTAKNMLENISWNFLCDGRTRNEGDIDKEAMRQIFFEVAAQFKEEREYIVQIDKETMRQIVFEVVAQFREAPESLKVPTYELNTKNGHELAEVD